MKMMKSVLAVTALWLLVLSPLPVRAAERSGPEIIDLKERFQVSGKKGAVLFPHHLHQEKAACQDCHVSAQGGGALKAKIDKKTGFKNDFHTNLCWPCHIDRKVPKGKSCKTCHR